jgi:bifunctional non-homologous end joining protein LigD
MRGQPPFPVGPVEPNAEIYAVAVTSSTRRPVAPMRAVLSRSVPSDDDRWAYEIKWDGMRAIAEVDDDTISLHTANLIDATDRFPELVGLAGAITPHRAVLDGEIVAFDPHGLPDFGRLQPRMQARSTRAVRETMAGQPVVYVVFDLLELGGESLVDLPYENRRHLLTELVEAGSNWRVTEAWIGGGQDLLDVMEERGMEGLIAKRLGSPYEVGRRSANWRKLKVRRQQEMVVGGWLPGEGARATTIGALLVGHHAEGSLRYAGRVGTGFRETELHRLRDELDSLGTSQCPFEPPPPAAVARRARWVEPTLVVEVAFREWTSDGVLRQPAYLGQRFDKDARDVVREEPAAP